MSTFEQRALADALALWRLRYARFLTGEALANYKATARARHTLHCLDVQHFGQTLTGIPVVGL